MESRPLTYLIRGFRGSQTSLRFLDFCLNLIVLLKLTKSIDFVWATGSRRYRVSQFPQINIVRFNSLDVCLERLIESHTLRTQN